MAQLGAQATRPAAARPALVALWAAPAQGAGARRPRAPGAAGARPGAVAVAAAERTDLELVRLQEHDDGIVVFTFGSAEERAAAEAQRAEAAQPEPEPEPEAEHEPQPAPAHPAPEPVITSVSQEPEVPLPEPPTAQEPEFVPEAPPAAAMPVAAAAAAEPLEPAAPEQPAAPPAPAASEVEQEQQQAIEQLTAEQPAACQPENNVVTAPAGAAANGKAYDAATLSGLKVSDLRGIARDNDLRGYSKLKKDDLIHLILTGSAP